MNKISVKQLQIQIIFKKIGQTTALKISLITFTVIAILTSMVKVKNKHISVGLSRAIGIVDCRTNVLSDYSYAPISCGTGSTATLPYDLPAQIYMYRASGKEKTSLY